MDKFKTIAKDGWHPERQTGKKESWRRDNKGINQVAGWVGKGKSNTSSSSTSHAARPISSLKDPSEFGPPPKNVNYYGPDATSTPTSSSSDPRGLGAPLSQAEISSAQQQQAAQEEENEAPSPPPAPFRVNTSGVEANNLPPPPRRVTEPAKGLPPTSTGAAQSAAPQSWLSAAAAAKPKPALPPRLPPRGAVANSSTSSTPATPPPPYEQPDQGAINRLARAGVNIPALGIGGDSQAQTQSPGSSSSRAPVNVSHGSGTMSELHSRFARMNAGSEGPGGGGAGGVQAVAAAAATAAAKKGPPPAPPKRSGVQLQAPQAGSEGAATAAGDGGPPPVPLSSKPR